MAPPNTKYRPYLTEPQILYLCTMLEPKLSEEGNGNGNGVASDIYANLSKYARKIQAGINVSSYHPSTNPQTIASKLGMDATPSPIVLTPAEKRQVAYQRRQQGLVLTPEEVELADTYEWEQQELTPNG